MIGLPRNLVELVNNVDQKKILKENINSQNNIIPLNEYYFGKNNLLKIIEDQFESLREEVLRNKIWIPRLSDNRLTTISKLLCELYGFSDVILDFSNSGRSNAYTVPISYSFTYWTGIKEYKCIKNPYGGVKYNPESGVILLVSFDLGLFTISELTASEAVAIVLHEVGHNFYTNKPTASAHNTINRLVSTIINPISIISSIFTGNTFKTIVTKIEDIIAGNKTADSTFQQLKMITNVLERLKNFLLTILKNGNLLDFWTVIKKYGPAAIITHILSPLGISFTIFGLNNEKYADNFASTYGYGPDLASALNKLENKSSDIDSILSKIYPVKILLEIILLPIYWITSLTVRTHPMTLSRIDEINAHLEDEMIKGNVNPKLAKYLSEDLDKSKELLNQQTKSLIDLDKSMMISNAMNVLLYKMTGKADVRDFILGTKNYDQEQFTTHK